MPFERYLNHQPSDDSSASAQQSAYDASLSPKHDVLLDTSIFSSNVQFQMHQLMLGPTLPPGGGAEVLPAGIVGHPNTVATNWLTPSFARYPSEWCVVL